MLHKKEHIQRDCAVSDNGVAAVHSLFRHALQH